MWEVGVRSPPPSTHLNIGSGKREHLGRGECYLTLWPGAPAGAVDSIHLSRKGDVCKCKVTGAWHICFSYDKTLFLFHGAFPHV